MKSYKTVIIFILIIFCKTGNVLCVESIFTVNNTLQNWIWAYMNYTWSLNELKKEKLVKTTTNISVRYVLALV